MPKWKPYLVWIVRAFGLALGLFLERDAHLPTNERECLIDGGIGFLVFFMGLGGSAFLEKTLAGCLHKFHAKVFPNRRISQFHNPSSWTFFAVGGWFFLSLGCGISVSSIWKVSFFLWQGFVFLLPGLGMIWGTNLARRILGKKN
jgi:hypothetical protein